MLFGVDPHPTMRKWHEHQDADERKRRSEFQEKFKLDYNAFRKLPLSAAQNISEHRTGAAPVTVKVSGRFGVVYDGSPTRPIPTSETREMPSGFGFLSPPPHRFNQCGQTSASTTYYCSRPVAIISTARGISLVEREHSQKRCTARARSRHHPPTCETWMIYGLATEGGTTCRTSAISLSSPRASCALAGTPGSVPRG